MIVELEKDGELTQEEKLHFLEVAIRNCCSLWQRINQKGQVKVNRIGDVEFVTD